MRPVVGDRCGGFHPARSDAIARGPGATHNIATAVKN